MLAFAIGAVSPASGQGPVRVAGRVVRLARGDTLPVPHANVVLHRIGRAAQGPIDSMPSDAQGRFRFRFAADTTALYLVSARFDDIEYFSPPVHTNPALPDTALIVAVSDTSVTAPVEVDARHLVISQPAKDGTRAVLDIAVLRNRGERTRVAPDSLTPSFALELPQGILGFQAGQGDFSAEAIATRHDSVLVFAPIAPGEKQLVTTYTVPADRTKLRFPFAQACASVDLLLEEFDAIVRGDSIARADSQTIEGHRFLRWSGPVGAGTLVTITFPGRGLAGWVLPMLVSIVALVLAGAAWRFRRPGLAPVEEPAGTAEWLLQTLARLDARYAGRESEFGAEEWARYLADRARLKDQLTTHLASRSPKA